MGDVACVAAGDEGDDFDGAAGDAVEKGLLFAVAEACDLRLSVPGLSRDLGGGGGRTNWLKKLVIPPFGISAISATKKNAHVIGSIKASFT